MHTLTLFGTPEDRIRIEGDPQAEFDLFDFEEGGFLAINDGTLLSIERDIKDAWKFNPVTVGEASSIERNEGPLDPDSEPDRVTLVNPHQAFRWALLGTHVAGPWERPESEA